jgi:cobalt-zinc-cadmium efflux system outer membrane protein
LHNKLAHLFSALDKDRRSRLRLSLCVFSTILLISPAARAQQAQALTWDQVKTKFEASNPALKADADNVDEMKAEESTAFLRPNPQLTLSSDSTQIARHDGAWQPLKGTDVVPNVSYLHERDHKRELRLDSAKEGTRITQSEHEDLERTMLFSLRTAFVATLQAKYVLDIAKTNIEYYDHIIQISQDRFNAGDIAEIDLDRIQLLRVQYEAEIETATVPALANAQ